MNVVEMFLQICLVSSTTEIALLNKIQGWPFHLRMMLV